jgi:tetratricopeptide (TPR) repeat protein
MRDKEILKNISRYLNGEMSVEEADQLWVEFLENPEYLKLLETEAHVRNYFQNKNTHNGQSISDDKLGLYEKSAPVYKNWLYAVAAILAVILMYSLASSGPQSEFHSELLSSIPAMEMATMDIYRTTKEGTEMLDLAINRGYEAAVSGRLDESFNHFSSLLEEQLQPAQLAVANLNLGILHFNNSDYDSASEAFSITANMEGIPDYLLEKSMWFFAHSLAREGKYNESIALFTDIYHYNGFYREEAENLIKLFDSVPGDS